MAYIDIPKREIFIQFERFFLIKVEETDKCFQDNIIIGRHFVQEEKRKADFCDMMSCLRVLIVRDIITSAGAQ